MNQFFRSCIVRSAVLFSTFAFAADDEAGRLTYRITECKYAQKDEIVCDMHVFNQTSASRPIGLIGSSVGRLYDESSNPYTSAQIDLMSADGRPIPKTTLMPGKRVFYRVVFREVRPGIGKASVTFRYGGLEFASIPVMSGDLR
jgi:hypothetical protein